MKLAYEAYGADGRRTGGVIEATSITAARQKLREGGLYATSLAEASDRTATSNDAAEIATDRARIWQPKLEQVAAFTREMSVLVSTGVPIADALAAVERQEKNDAWAEIISEIRSAVEQGRSLSEAMSKRHEYFSPVYRSLVAAGEEAGELDTMLSRLAALVRQQLVVRKGVTGALIYPIALLGLSITACVVMLLVVVPRFAGMFASLDAELPVTTKLLVDASAFLIAYWWAAAVAMISAVIAAFLWLRTSTGRRAVDRFVLTGPIVAPLARGLGEARIARMLSTLLAAHLPLLDAIDLVSDAMTNSEYRRLTREAKRSVSEGDGLTAAFESSDFVTPRFVEAVRTGESTGRIAAVLSNLADHGDHDNDAAIKGLTKTIEPVIITAMGVVVVVGSPT